MSVPSVTVPVRTGGAAPVPGPAPAPAPEAPRSFVPLTGPATWHPADPPREGSVEFTDHRRTVVPADPGGDAGAHQGRRRRGDPPERGPARARGAAGAPPRRVGPLHPRSGPLGAVDAVGRGTPSACGCSRAARAHEGTDDPEQLVREVLAAVVDTLAALPPSAPSRPRHARRNEDGPPRRTPHDTRLRAPTPGPDRPPRARTAPGEPAPTSDASRCGWRPTRRNWSRVRCGWCSR